MPTPQGKFWCWTINNPTVEEEETLQTLHILSGEVQYLVFQKEQGEQGTQHLQGYVEFSSRKTLRQAKVILGTQRIHLERRRGTADQARIYCIKEDGRLDGPWEFGEFSGTRASTAGTRTDLAAVKAAIEGGATEGKLADEFFSLWCQYHNAFRRYRGLCHSQRNHKTRTIVIVGPPGTGKSRWCMDSYKEAYWKQRSIWWDSYEGHESVVLDDFYGWLPYDVVLRMCDRYPLMIETKGGQCQFVAKTVVFTSNNTPAQWYKNVNLDAFIRRVDRWMYFGIDGTKLDTENYSHFCNAVDRNFNMITN